MLVIIYEDHGKEPKILGTATYMSGAAACAERHYGNPIRHKDFQKDEDGRLIYCIGDASYVIERTQHWF